MAPACRGLFLCGGASGTSHDGHAAKKHLIPCRNILRESEMSVNDAAQTPTHAPLAGQSKLTDPRLCSDGNVS